MQDDKGNQLSFVHANEGGTFITNFDPALWDTYERAIKESGFNFLSIIEKGAPPATYLCSLHRTSWTISDLSPFWEKFREIKLESK